MHKYAPSIIENGGQLPCSLPQAIQRKIEGVLAKAAKCVEINDGVIKGDIVVSGGKVHIIEIAGRLSGGYFCTHEIPLNTGVDFVGAAIKQAVGWNVEPNSLVPKQQKFVAQRYFFPSPGVVSSIKNVERFHSHPDVELLEIRVDIGDEVSEIHNHPGRAGVVITKGKDAKAAVDLAEAVVAGIEIRTE